MKDLKEYRDPVDPNVKKLALTAAKDLDLATGVEEVKQRLETNLSFIRGEYYFAPDKGLPFFSEIFRKQTKEPIAMGYLRQAILDTKGVKVIRSLTRTQIAPRQWRINFEVEAENGALIEGAI